MIALLIDRNEWKAFWTFADDEVQAIDDCIQQAF
jgi:hypothetical protein